MSKPAQNNLSFFNFTTLWFGAAISVAEILAGSLLAPLGFRLGLLAIVIGHLVGTTLLALSGVIGSRERIPSLESTRISFGLHGSRLFSVLNVLQLLGWTAVMIIVGARAANEITKALWAFDHLMAWSLLIGAFILLWVWLGKDSGWRKVNQLAVLLLFCLTVVLSVLIFRHHDGFQASALGEMSFGLGLELTVVMPLSWLPLISDYTRFAKSSRAGALGSWLGYFVGSCWMYGIGLGAALLYGDPDLPELLLAVNLGLVALCILVLATVTTTFLDAYSAGVTCINIFPNLREKTAALIITALGTVLAIVVNVEQYENFLYAIGSVFAPLFAVLLTDYFLLKNTRIREELLADWGALCLCAWGTVFYYQFLKLDFVLGATVPVMVTISVLRLLTRRLTSKWKSVSKYPPC